ncbi:MAG: hypothetical protein ACI9D5_001169 [Candidatus Endobugula sp.]|jgi:hypothetical protein
MTEINYSDPLIFEETDWLNNSTQFEKHYRQQHKRRKTAAT